MVKSQTAGPGSFFSRHAIFSLFCSLLILVSGSIALLWQIQQGHLTHATKADVGNVIGPPTLPAALVDHIFASMGSPMAGTGSVVEQAARQANIDDAFALGVWWTETNDGAAGVGIADRNPGSVRGSIGFPSAFDGYTIYPSYAAAIVDWFTVLKTRYISRGLTSVYTICYPYVGTSSSLLWANKVVNLMLRYHQEAPPPVVVSPAQLTQLGNNITANGSLHTAMSATGQGQQESEARALQHQSTQQPTQVATATTPSAGKLIIMLLGLLLALAIAIVSKRMGYTPVSSNLDETQRTWAPAERPVPVIQEPITPPVFTDGVPQLAFPPLFVNQYSPIHDTEPLEETPIERQLRGISLAAQMDWHERTNEQQIGTGRRQTEALPRRIALRPARFEPEISRRAEPQTDTLQEPVAVGAQEPMPVPIRRGLLARYGNGQNETGQ